MNAKTFFLIIVAALVAKALWALFVMKIEPRANKTEDWEKF